MDVRETTYILGHAVIRQLRPLTECEQEKAAVQRLEDFRGTERDVRIAAALFERVGEHANAREVLWLLPASGSQMEIERLAFELWSVSPDGRPSAVFDEWRRVWGTGTNAVPYRRSARRVLELLQKGDAAAPTPEGGIAALRLGLGVDSCEHRTR